MINNKKHHNNIIRQIIVITVLPIVLLCFGCGENYLVENPKTSLSEGVFWQNADEAHKALMGCYANNGGGPERMHDLDKRMVFMGHWTGTSSWRDFGYGRERVISPTHGTITTVWQNSFRKIARANYFLDNIDKVNMDETEKDVMKGEARFLRAFTYFWLYQLWENVPLIKATLTFEEANTIAQASKEEIVNFILTELTTAAQELPVKQPPNAKGRAEKGAALAIKGRLLMAKKQWTEAANTYKEIMDLNRYSIDPRFKELFEEKGENNNEVIFANKYKENELGESTTQHTMKSSIYGGFNSCNIFQHVLDKFPMIDGNPIEDSDMYDPENPFENRDPRLYASILITGYSEVYGEIFQGDPVTIAKTGQTGPNITGYISQKFWDREYEGNSQSYGGDYPQIRYAEVLLSRLESELEAGNSVDQNLLDITINLVRKREAINMPPVTETNPEALREIVRRERFVELIFEGGVEYFDFKRWGTLQKEVSQQLYGMKVTNNPDEYDGIQAVNENGHLIIGNLEFYDYNYLWPIPLYDLDVNDNLMQNPGYN